MEKNAISWITIILMWMLYVIYPAMTKRFNTIEIVVSLLLVGGITIYGFFYKENRYRKSK